MKFFPLVWATLWRKRTRTILTLLSVVVAFLLFGLLEAVSVAFSNGANAGDSHRLVVAGKYSFTEILPLAYLQRIRSIAGVQDVTHATWFGGVYQTESNFFPQFAVDADTYLTVYDNFLVAPAQKDAFIHTRTGALVGSGLARRFGWKIGDKIPIQATIWPKVDGSNAWDFDIVGFIDPKNESERAQTDVMLFHYDYFDEARQFGKSYVGWYIVKVAPAAQPAVVAAAIDKEFANSPRETRTDSEQAFNAAFIKQMGDIELIITSILGAVFFTLLFLTGNTMMQSVRDRVPELAVLKTIGFSDRAVLTLVLAESLMLCLLAALIGLGLADLIMPVLASRMPGLDMSPQVILGGCGIAVVLALIVGILPALRAMRLDIVNALAGH
ncbi:MAG: ABC transporter permease [Stenotrophobium sp.]